MPNFHHWIIKCSVFEEVHPILYFHLKQHNTLRMQTLAFKLLKSYGTNSDEIFT